MDAGGRVTPEAVTEGWGEGVIDLASFLILT